MPKSETWERDIGSKVTVCVTDEHRDGKAEIYDTFFFCPYCNQSVLIMDYFFCPMCGARVAWKINKNFDRY